MIEWKSTLHVRSVHAIPRFGTPLLIAHIHATKQPSENKSAKNSIHLNILVLCLFHKAFKSTWMAYKWTEFTLTPDMKP